MHNLIVLLQYATILALAGFAQWRGAGPEKIATGTMATMALCEILYHSFLPDARSFFEVDAPHLLIDAIGFSGFAYLTVRANRIYPICLLGVQIFVMMAHFDREMVEGMLPQAYAFMIRMPSYLQVAILTTGLLLHIRRQRKFGPYRSWRTSSGHSWAKKQVPQQER